MKPLGLVAIPAFALVETTLSVETRFLYVLLLYHAQGGEVVGATDLAAEMGATDRSVRRWLADLEAAGLVKRLGTLRRHGLAVWHHPAPPDPWNRDDLICWRVATGHQRPDTSDRTPASEVIHRLSTGYPPSRTPASAITVNRTPVSGDKEGADTSVRTEEGTVAQIDGARTAVSGDKEGADTAVRIEEGASIILTEGGLLEGQTQETDPKRQGADGEGEEREGGVGETWVDLFFRAFWSAWPNPGSPHRGSAREVWQAEFKGYKGSLQGKDLMRQIMEGLARWKASRSWQEGKVTHPAVWLRKRQWRLVPPA